ncbi:hypothetical protein Ae201684P_014669 [Aphanomyces euteiches]|uniref:Uncharacterized protein n=1 Tax=Aphanomyces euteiches TaxID=100861 RepID=A0A6G0WY50_9STRA|nr:hypothetical protein Ae201684_010521 [Aphanomyces euteiches]KAH9089914.1 hypothetical protein Ae201684P_014669 [Aphanomyces euteiches]
MSTLTLKSPKDTNMIDNNRQLPGLINTLSIKLQLHQKDKNQHASLCLASDECFSSYFQAHFLSKRDAEHQQKSSSYGAADAALRSTISQRTARCGAHEREPCRPTGSHRRNQSLGLRHGNTNSINNGQTKAATVFPLLTKFEWGPYHCIRSPMVDTDEVVDPFSTNTFLNYMANGFPGIPSSAQSDRHVRPRNEPHVVLAQPRHSHHTACKANGFSQRVYQQHHFAYASSSVKDTSNPATRLLECAPPTIDDTCHPINPSSDVTNKIHSGSQPQNTSIKRNRRLKANSQPSSTAQDSSSVRKVFHFGAHGAWMQPLVEATPPKKPSYPKGLPDREVFHFGKQVDNSTPPKNEHPLMQSLPLGNFCWPKSAETAQVAPKRSYDEMITGVPITDPSTFACLSSFDTG